MKPFRVQCHRPGQFTSWFTDSEAETLAAGISAVEVLHRQWGRKARVIDAESGKTLYQQPPRKPRGRSEEL